VLFPEMWNIGYTSYLTKEQDACDLWRAPEWLVSASGVVVVGCMVAAALLGAPGLQFSVYPLVAPTLPVLAAVGILVGLAPAWVAPVDRRCPPVERVRPVGAAGAPATDATAAPATDADADLTVTSPDPVPAALPGDGIA